MMGGEYFCSLKAHALMTWKQRRTVLLFNKRSDPTLVPLGVSGVFNDLSYCMQDSYMEPTHVGSYIIHLFMK